MSFGLVKVPDASEISMLQDILAAPHTLRLYVNEKTPADADAAEDYVEMSTLGYAVKPLTYDHWDFTEGNPGGALYDALQSFAFSAGTPIKVYGLFVTRDSDGKLRWAERFYAEGTEPIDYMVVGNADGDKIEFIPAFALGALA